MKILNPLTMPLKGLNLIEASAGTGKTYTITTLYLRLLLGLAEPGKETECLSVDKILVVTFTEAATEEIRDRVRRRLNEAKLAIFLRDIAAAEKDPLLSELIQSLPDPELAYKRLDAAVKMMDEAAIFTIHGFCQRMLKQHAFESGSLFDNQFILDERQYLQSSIKDFWRCTVYPMSGPLLSLFLQCWAAPERLLKDLLPLLNKHQFRSEPQLDVQRLHRQVDEYAALSAEVKQLWLAEQIPALIIDSAILASRKPGKAEYLEAFTEFCLSEDLTFAKGSDSWELWSEEVVTKAVKKGGQPPQHPIFAKFTRLAALKVTLKTDIAGCYKQMALQQLRQNLQALKRQNQKISPDDLLLNLATALASEDKGAVLGARIAKQYPVAMIDEFQDTDPLQYGIFSRIYQPDLDRKNEESSEHSSTMVMIGDPKQAIYGFRGADIFTYIQAKGEVASDAQYTLNINWRSSSALIAGINGLFNSCEDAFMYRDAIDFYPVDAATKADAKPLRIDGESTNAALRLWHLTGEDDLPISKSNASGPLAIRCANEIAQLLDKARQGQAKIGNKPVVAGDICVLVRDRNEAAVVRNALTEAGVSSVFLSRQSVFETQLAFEFYLLLKAVFERKNERAIRAVLITGFFGYDLNRLWDLSQNEDDWQTVLNLFERLHYVLERYGVMAVLQHLLVNNNLAGRWRETYVAPQRMLTDIRHLAELLQQQSMALDGVNRLLAWYHEQLIGASDEGKVQQLRLEDDSNLVQIVTMHASKGLEYNIVFVPFVCGFRCADTGMYHDKNGLVIDFTNQPENITKADQERLAEDLRLLYVALTRAVHRCYIGIFNLRIGNGKASQLAQTALGHLLFKSLAVVDQAAIANRLQQLCQTLNQTGDICAIETFDTTVASIQVSLAEPQTLDQHFQPFTGTIEQDWKVTSYSALANDSASVHIQPGGTDEGETFVEVAEPVTERHDRFEFPKGANAGSCLHEILEHIDFTRFGQDPQDSIALESAFARYGIDNTWLEISQNWMAAVLDTKLNKQGLKLNQLTSSQRLVEMEFYLSMNKVAPGQINQLLSEHLERPCDELRFAPVQGILKGYIDLVFQWQGQYFVLDYKSNYLGDSFDDYGKVQMAQAMQQHNYHLQYLLYSLALHRYLKNRLPDYQYERHFGGNYYLFLRGMDPQNKHHEGVYFSRPSEALIEKLDKLFCGELPRSSATQASLQSPQQLGLWGA